MANNSSTAITIAREPGWHCHVALGHRTFYADRFRGGDFIVRSGSKLFPPLIDGISRYSIKIKGVSIFAVQKWLHRSIWIVEIQQLKKYTLHNRAEIIMMTSRDVIDR